MGTKGHWRNEENIINYSTEQATSCPATKDQAFIILLQSIGSNNIFFVQFA